MAGIMQGVDLSRAPVVVGEPWWIRLKFRLSESGPIDMEAATELEALARPSIDDPSSVTIDCTPAADGWVRFDLDADTTATMRTGTWLFQVRFNAPPWGLRTWVLNGLPVLRGVIR